MGRPARPAARRPDRRVRLAGAAGSWTGSETRIIGIDEDLPAMRTARPPSEDLVTWSLGDLRSVPLPPRSFDVIYCRSCWSASSTPSWSSTGCSPGCGPAGCCCSDARPDVGLRRVRPADAVLAAADALAAPGRPAGTLGPLPAVYEPVTSRDGMHAFCLIRGLMVTDDHERHQRPGHGPLGRTPVPLTAKPIPVDASRLTRRDHHGHQKATEPLRPAHLATHG